MEAVAVAAAVMALLAALALEAAVAAQAILLVVGEVAGAGAAPMVGTAVPARAAAVEVPAAEVVMADLE